MNSLCLDCDVRMTQPRETRNDDVGRAPVGRAPVCRAGGLALLALFPSVIFFSKISGGGRGVGGYLRSATAGHEVSGVLVWPLLLTEGWGGNARIY